MASKTTTEPETVEPVTIIGRLVADPVLRYTATSQKPVTNIRVAVSNGSQVTYHRVVVWGRQAEVVCQFLRKGSAVEVDGRTQERSYQPAEGDERMVTEIIARAVHFLGHLPEKDEEEAA